MVVDGLGYHGLMNWKIFGLPSIFHDVACLVCCLGFRSPSVGHMATVVQCKLFSTCVVSDFGGGHSRQQR